MFFFLHLNNTVSSENKMLAHVHKYYAVFKSSGSEVIFPNYLRSMFILICGQLEFVYIHIQLFLNWYRCWPHLFSLFLCVGHPCRIYSPVTLLIPHVHSAYVCQADLDLVE